MQGNTTTITGSDLAGYKEGIGSEARFDGITSFEAINKTHLVLVDRYNHCLRTVDRTSRRTESFLGLCEHSGLYVNGEVRLNEPTDILLWKNDGISIAFLSEYGNNRVLLLSWDSEQAPTSVYLVPIDFDITHPFSMCLSSDKTFVYITTSSGLQKINTNSTSFEISQPSTSQTASSLAIVDPEEKLLLMTDSSSGSLYVYDEASESVYDLCSANIPCSQLASPQAVFIMKSERNGSDYAAYIGHRHGISRWDFLLQSVKSTPGSADLDHDRNGMFKL